MPAVLFDSVSKRFRLHHERPQSFQEALINLFYWRNGSTEEFWALKDVSFEIEYGETFGIIGPNGSGKSTALKLITKVLQPTTGVVKANGRFSAMIELGAGFHPDLTGRENVFLLGSILGFSAKDMRRRFDKIVAFSELERFIDTPVKHYSSGMYMRLGFSVLISADPDILIIDEVMAVGDLAFQEKCVSALKGFQRDGKTILMVSHDLDLIRSFCDRAILLERGEIAAEGSVEKVISTYMSAQAV